MKKKSAFSGAMMFPLKRTELLQELLMQKENLTAMLYPR